jgi:nucleoside-diphosphate-sugar epimerase
VVHLAALSNDPVGEIDSSLTLDINYKGAVRVAELAKKAKVKRFIFVSTQSIYGFSEKRIELDEDNSIKNPQTAYASSKWLAEQEILSMANQFFTTTALRPSTVFGWGPRLRSDIVFNNLLLYGMKFRKINVHSDGTPWRPVVHINDLVRAIDICIRINPEKISGKAFNIGLFEGNYNVKQIAEAARDCLGDVPIFYNTENILDSRSYQVSFIKALSVLDFKASISLKLGGTELITESKKLMKNGIELMDRKTNRLLQLNYLLSNGYIDKKLRFIS